MVAALGVGWLLSELMHGQSVATPSRIELDGQVAELLRRRQQQPLDGEEERLLLEQLLALERLADSWGLWTWAELGNDDRETTVPKAP